MRHLQQTDFPSRAEEQLAHGVVETEDDGDHNRNRSADEPPHAEFFIVGGHVGHQQGQAQPDHDGKEHVRGREEHFVQVRRGTVHGHIQQDDQQHRETQVNGGQTDDPGAFALVHAVDEQEGQHADKHEHPAEGLRETEEQVDHLVHEPHGVLEDVRAMDAFILAAAQGVEEAFHFARITPLHGRDGHAGDGFVEVEGNPHKTHHDDDDDRFPFGADALREGAQPDAGGEGADADDVEQHLFDERHVLHGRDRAHAREAEEIARAVDQNQVAAQLGLHQGDEHFHAHHAQNQGLVNRGADAVAQHGHVQEAPLIGRVGPAHHEQEHQRQPRHGEEGDAVNGDRFAPDKSVKPDQQTRHEAGDGANRGFPLLGHFLQRFNAFDQHAAAAGHHDGHKAAAHRRPEGFAHLDAPGDVAPRQDDRPEPAVDGPERVAGRMRNARVERTGAKLAAVLQGHFRCEGVKIDPPDDDESDQHGQPVHGPEQGRHFHRGGRRGRSGRGCRVLRFGGGDFGGVGVRRFHG